MIKKIKILYAIFLLFPAIVYAQTNYALRDQEVKRALDKAEARIEASKPKNEYKPLELSKTLRFLLGNQAYATFGLQTGYISGNSTYHIGFDNPYAVGGHEESELEWALKNCLLGMDINVNYKMSAKPDETRLMSRFGLSWFTRIGKGSGKIKDSDWIENDIGYIDYIDDYEINDSAGWVTNHPGKDIYSESDVKWDKGYLVDLNYTYNFWPIKSWGIGPFFGYRYQKFGLSAFNLNQIGYGPYTDPAHPEAYATYKDTQGRKWLSYMSEYQFPYLGLSSELNWKDKVSLLFNFGYSDWARAKDQDSHLYPTEDEYYGMNHDMISRGKYKGEAYIMGFKGDLKFWPDWLFSLGTSYVSIDTKGSTRQYDYWDGFLMGETDPIDNKVTSEYWVIDLAAKYIF